MDRLIDEIVTVKVSDALASAASTSVNTVAVLGVSSKEGAAVTVEYNLDGTNDSVAADFSDTSDLYKVAESFFKEENTTGKLVCIPTSAEPSSSNIKTILDNAVSAGKDKNGRTIDFYNVIVRMDAGTSAKDIKDMADELQDWCKDNYKIAHVEIQNRAIAEAVVLKYEENPLKRVYFYFHDETKKRSLAAALVTSRCYSDPARGTWAHKTLTSVEPDATSKSNLADAKEKGLNIYCTVAGVNRTFFGSAAGGKYYIDEQIKKDWLMFRTQEAVFNILGSANNGDGVDYNDAGISAIAAAINNIFTIAADNDHRYIMPDSFDVQVPKYADIAKDKKEERILPDVKVPFAIQSSIHTVKYVELQVVSA